MSFVDLLRLARQGATTLLHEFKNNYDPQQPRVHAFVEGYEDLVFYRAEIQKAAGPKCRVYMYRCGNKNAVYETFGKLQADGTLAGTLFFADKDLADIVGETWTQDDRIFVTDVYSIENYFVSRDVFQRLCVDFIRLTNFNFDFEPVFEHFEEQLQHFHKQILTLMAWIVVSRMAGLRPNVNNINLSAIFSYSNNCTIRPTVGRSEYLVKATGVRPPDSLISDVQAMRGRLVLMEPKLVVRGKFEMWFMISFTQRFIEELTIIAGEVGGSIGLRVQINQQNPIEALVGRIPTPGALAKFLNAHFPRQAELF